MRVLQACILCNHCVSNPQELWDTYQDSFCYDWFRDGLTHNKFTREEAIEQIIQSNKDTTSLETLGIAYPHYLIDFHSISWTQ